MARTIKNVALAGATGHVGSHALTALVDLGFNVTVLSRAAKTFPAGVAVKVVNYDSPDSLSEALHGQDAVIDATFSTDVETPLRLIDAAVANKVYRFITSDFGLDPDLPGVHDLPVFGRKKISYEAVKRKSEEAGLTYTLIACGAFLDFNLSTGFAGIDLKSKSVTMFDDGENVAPWTTLQDIGRATAAALLHPEETLNRPVYIHNAFLSQRKLLEAAKEALGADGWTTTTQDMKASFDKALEELSSGQVTPMTFGVQIQYALATKDLARPWSRDDNALVGVKEWTKEEVKELIKKLASE